MKFIKTITVPSMIFTLLLILSGCQEGGDYAFNNYDEDGDEQWDNNEFETAFSENSDYYDQWDDNEDGGIDEDEWKDGVSTYYSEYNYDEDGEFDNWDTNADEVIDDSEFAEGTYDLWDENDDGYVDSEEYESWNYDNENQENV